MFMDRSQSAAGGGICVGDLGQISFCFRCRRFLFPETVSADRPGSAWPLPSWQRAGR